jgi:hypothetical protein
MFFICVFRFRTWMLMKIDMFVLLGIEEDLQFQKWNKRKINNSFKLSFIDDYKDEGDKECNN